MTSTMSTTSASVNVEVTQKKVYDVEQNKLLWKPIDTNPTMKSEIRVESLPTSTTKVESSTIGSSKSVQSSESLATTETVKDKSDKSENDDSIADNELISTNIPESLDTINWVPVTQTEAEELTTEEPSETKIVNKKVPSTKGFESITKLPSGITTPQGDEIIHPISPTSEKLNIEIPLTESIPEKPFTTETTNDDITTIRFSYVPMVKDFNTEKVEPSITTDSWHPVTPSTTVSTIEDTPITTYRPKYTTTEMVQETTNTLMPETETVSDEIITRTDTEAPTSTTMTETKIPTSMEVIIPTKDIPMDTTTDIETTTIIVEVVTEINTERETRKPTQATTEVLASTTVLPTTVAANYSPNHIDSSSEENSGSNEVITHVRVTTTTTSEASTNKDVEMTIVPMLSPNTDPPMDPQTETIEQPKQPTELPTEFTTNYEEAKKSSIELSTFKDDSNVESTTEELTTRLINDLEDLSSYAGDMTTEASSRVLDEAGSGAAVAIAVSTIGVIALVLLVGLLVSIRINNIFKVSNNFITLRY